MSKGSWLVHVGSIVATGGAGLCVAYLIHHLSTPNTSFWDWPGVTGVALVVIGITMIIATSVTQSHANHQPLSPQVIQHQKVGDGSTALQANGDITISSTPQAPQRSKPPASFTSIEQVQITSSHAQGFQAGGNIHIDNTNVY